MAELRTFLFTDICGSVHLKNEMQGRSVSERDLAFINSILTPHRQRIEERLAEFGGRVVSTAGDGHFLVFDHTAQAALWAVSVQESHRDDPIMAPGDEPIEVRISIHSGVPQIDPGDPNNFIGKSVDYASRLNDYATGGQILISRSVMAILDDVGLEGLKLHLHGRRTLKGIGNVEVHELIYGNNAPRPLRNQPKSENTERQWTVVPTMFGDPHGGATTIASPTTTLRQVGNYALEELLGSGGMGDVYKARHTQFGRVRAVKVIKQQYVSAGHTEVIRRFYNEIKAVGRLEHRNIVVAIDSSAPTDNVHYLVMEYIEGVSLDELVAQHGPLPVAEACEVIRQAARGLQYIHKHEMVHRDLKPSNLMITLVDGEQVQSDSTLTQAGDGQRAVVKILDLGLALLATEGQDRLTRFDHKAMGTGMYMPPEQWKTSSVDIRADIYSLGCTLYHLLAGNPPFFDSDLRPEKAHEKIPAPQIRSSIQPVPKKLW
jgi:class 3 adenylate cyclase/tRNA A-37 threonylcarbamoyl transferase component Bud32